MDKEKKEEKKNVTFDIPKRKKALIEMLRLADFSVSNGVFKTFQEVAIMNETYNEVSLMIKEIEDLEIMISSAKEIKE